MRSVPAQRIDAIIRLKPAMTLKERGFKKNARRFHSYDGRSVAHVEFQASQWNTDESAKFTINLGRYFPELAKISGEEVIKEPTRQWRSWHWGSRIGHVMPQHEDFWWTVTPQDNLQNLADEVAATLETFALPYLERVSTVEGVAALGGYIPGCTQRHASLSVASALWALGRRDEAIRELREFAKGTREISPRAIRWAKANGVELSNYALERTREG